MNYENRIVLFIDMLGFKDVILKSIGNENYIDSIYGVIESISHFFDSHEMYSKSKVVTQFSDSIVISFLEDEISEVYYTLADIQKLIVLLINQGFVFRGGISYGKLIHNDIALFGPAFIDAYYLESKKANYPRIIVTEDVVNIGENNHAHRNSKSKDKYSLIEKKWIERIILQDDDGFYFVNYFINDLENMGIAEKHIDKYHKNLENIIETGLLNSDIRIKEKYLWMKDNFNKLITAPNRVGGQ